MVASLIDLSSASTTVKYFTVAYYEAEGYYAKNDPRRRRASFWHGEGAAALGLPQHVSPRTFERVLAGYVPGTEIRLGRARDGEHEHRPGLDLTLSAPKSVSLEALLYGNRRVLGAHDAAVRSTLDWVEAELLQTRGYDPATGRRPRVAADGLVAAGFRHLTSRNQDPQLHTHCILANMTRNRAGEWRSVEPTEIRRNVKLIGAYYRQELARRLIALGLRIETTMIGGAPGFEIAGYPREMLDTFSSRRREILAWLDAHGLPYSAALTQQAALITRKRKVDEVLEPVLASDALLVSDAHRCYPPVAAALDIPHESINASAGERVRGAVHIQTVNSRHRQIKSFVRGRRGIATKYLDSYLRWFHLIELGNQPSPRACLEAAMARPCLRLAT